jgi:glycosyltransferase involved in cell wall biosynthesis
MRILVNAMSARQGGGQTYLRNLFAHLPGEAPDGSAVEVFLVAPAALRGLAAPGRIEYLPVSPLAENPFARAPWERFLLPRLVRRLSADILFSPGGTTTLRPPAPCRSVTMFRNMIPFDMAQRRRYPPGYQRVRNWLLERIMLDAMTGADLVIFISNYARQVVEARAGGPMRASVVIPHGVSDRFRVGPQPLPAPGWTPREGFFLYVSTLDFYKNQLEVIRGFLQAKAAAGFAEKLLIVGPGNPVYVSLLRKEIAERGAQSEILLPGSVPYEDLPALYQNARINIFASEAENCPNILLEALASGRPVLCSDRPPMPEFAGDAVAYFDPRSPAACASSLLELLDSAQRRSDLAQRATIRSRRYAWSEAARGTWEAILNCATLPHSEVSRHG